MPEGNVGLLRQEDELKIGRAIDRAPSASPDLQMARNKVDLPEPEGRETKSSRAGLDHQPVDLYDLCARPGKMNTRSGALRQSLSRMLEEFDAPAVSCRAHAPRRRPSEMSSACDP